MLLEFIKKYINSGSTRSQLAKKNIIASFLNKGVAIIISLLLVPVTIDYLNAEQYGIWLTLSSIVAWISYFDVGLGHGFRNRFAESKAIGDDVLARKYVSTTYISLFIIFGVILVVAEIANPFIDWAAFLKVDPAIKLMLQSVVAFLLVGVCFNFVLNVCPILLSADQRPAYSAMITTVSQGISLAVIYLLTKTTEGNMVYIAIALSWLPCLVILLVSCYLFKGKYHAYSPSLKYVDFGLFRNIIGLGGKFFVIQISMLLIFQVTNIILSRVLGPESVTEFNIAYKYFSITQMVFTIILTPFWSAYTEAYAKQDFDWMNRILQKLRKTWILLFGVNFLLLILSPFCYKIWLHGSVEIATSVSVGMMVYMSVLSYSNMYMILLNGIGKVFLQMIVYIVCAVFAIPVCYVLCGEYGICGILVVLSSVYALQAVVARVQLSKILTNTSIGVWNR